VCNIVIEMTLQAGNAQSAQMHWVYLSPSYTVIKTLYMDMCFTNTTVTGVSKHNKL